MRAFYPFVAAHLLSLAATAAEVGQRTLPWFDVRRQRPVVTEVWYPSPGELRRQDREDPGRYLRTPTVRDGPIAAGQHPLLLLSHGTGGGRLTMEWLAAGLARRGYIVAAVDHWGNTHDNAIPEHFLKSWERPQDLSFALDEFLRDAEFGPRLRRDAIGAMGFSLGGYTVLALAGGVMDLTALSRFSRSDAGHREAALPGMPPMALLMQDQALQAQLAAEFAQAPSLVDPRIKAVVAFAPALGPAFTSPEQFPPSPPPILIVGAEADQLAPVATNAAHYHTLLPHSRLVILPGSVGHFVFLNEADPLLQKQLPALFIDHPSVVRRQVHEEMIQLAAAFFAEHLGAARRASDP